MDASSPLADADVVTLTACPACGGDRHRRLATPGRWIGPEVFAPLTGRLGLAGCRDCGLVFVNPRPSSARLGAFYAGSTYDCHETAGSSSAGKVADHLMTIIERHLPAAAPRHVLDYGAGGGGFLLSVRERGWRASGLEPGRRGLTACRAAGLDMVERPEELPDARFGLVTFHHVFEHLEDPAAVLATVRRVLAPDGRLFIEVPNASALRARLAMPWLTRRFAIDERYRAFPIHLAYYSRATLTRVLADAGWAVEHSFTVGLGLDEYFVSDPAKHPPAPSSAPAPQKDQAADAAPVAGSHQRKRLRHRLRDGFLGMGWGENLAVIARPLTPESTAA
ncbi:MAG: class I SAM-dependent methyltransferase [Xanthomonadales bacterium]|nr:class I SAM-dependent methyltransferase [Xanthomonadales bacterium]